MMLNNTIFHRMVVQNEKHGAWGTVKLAQEFLHRPVGKVFDVSFKVLNDNMDCIMTSLFSFAPDVQSSMPEMITELANSTMDRVVSILQHGNNTESENSILRKSKVLMVVATVSDLDDLATPILGTVSLCL
jgi:hypothetical protein